MQIMLPFLDTFFLFPFEEVLVILKVSVLKTGVPALCSHITLPSNIALTHCRIITNLIVFLTGPWAPWGLALPFFAHRHNPRACHNVYLINIYWITFVKYSSNLKCFKNNILELSRYKILFLGSLSAHLLKFMTLSSIKHHGSIIGRVQSLIVKSTSFLNKLLKFIQTLNLTFNLKTICFTFIFEFKYFLGGVAILHFDIIFQELISFFCDFSSSESSIFENVYLEHWLCIIFF